MESEEVRRQLAEYIIKQIGSKKYNELWREATINLRKMISDSLREELLNRIGNNVK